MGIRVGGGSGGTPAASAAHRAKPNSRIPQNIGVAQLRLAVDDQYAESFGPHGPLYSGSRIVTWLALAPPPLVNTRAAWHLRDRHNERSVTIESYLAVRQHPDQRCPRRDILL